MDTFATITAALSMGGSLIRLANTPPPAAEYLLTSVLPREIRPDFEVRGGTLKINTVMAGLVGMDSPYPQGSSIQLSTFNEKTAKIAMTLPLSEEHQRELNKFLDQAQLGRLGNRTRGDLMSEAALNLYEKGCIQALDDTEEYLRAKALMTGAISWTFNKKTLTVDYNVPAGNKFVARTGVNGYGGSSSKFWADYLDADAIVQGAELLLMSNATLNKILNNPAHNIRVISDIYSPQRNIRRVQVVRAVQTASGITVGDDRDARYSVTLTAYLRKGNIVDPTTTGGVIQVNLIPDNKIAVIGRRDTNQLISIDGTPTPQSTLGYTHIAPTIEGQNVNSPLGRFGRLFTPDQRPWELIAEAVENCLPVIEAPERIVLLETD
ncbi:major capsid protein [Deinococcus sp. HMF7604]|uniref:major capsid protein n=1 Tax=Deinococcus betulae TaxID=2873312 RepID=UPI001CC9A267|nr:major capsid protein [Deinococcus betulae]MBZ9753184.1 major capsid protein [Deinococcus betulae]